MDKKFSDGELKQIRKKLSTDLKLILNESGENIAELQELGASKYSDPNDRASMESERDLDLRIRERENKLVSKINKIIKRIDSGNYQVCENCGEFIPKERLKAREITDLCINCKELEEQGERLL